MPSLLGGLLCRPQRFGFQKHGFVDDMRMRMIKPEMASRKAKFSADMHTARIDNGKFHFESSV